MNFGQEASKKKIWLVNILVFLLIVTIFLIVRYFADKSVVPEDFVNSRLQSSVIAADITSLIGGSLDNLNSIAEADRNYNFGKALNLVAVEQERIEDVKFKAVKLNDELNAMARSIPEIKPNRAGNLALEAASERVSLVGKLIIYNSYLSALLETLKLKFSGSIRYDSTDVQKLIENMNREAREINQLNESFRTKMAEFDKEIKDNNKFIRI